MQQYHRRAATDTYAAFNAVNESGRVAEAAYWAHARREFYGLHVADEYMKQGYYRGSRIVPRARMVVFYALIERFRPFKLR